MSVPVLVTVNIAVGTSLFCPSTMPTSNQPVVMSPTLTIFATSTSGALQPAAPRDRTSAAAAHARARVMRIGTPFEHSVSS